MSNGLVVTNNGRKICLNRSFNVTPTYQAPTLFKVGTGTNTPTTADVDLQTAILIGGASTKILVSGYPILDETNMQVTFRALLLTTECNGNTLTEFGMFNNDGTPLMFSRIVYTGVAKTSSIQIYFVEKDKIEV